VHISRDVIFDETVYPFHKLNPNDGARLRAEILLLPSTSQNHGPGDEFMDGSMTDILVNYVATNPVCPAAASKKLSQNNASLSSGGHLEELSTEAGRGSGAECEVDVLHESCADSNLDSHAASDQTSSEMRGYSSGWHVAASPDVDLWLRSPERCMAARSDADSSSADVSSMDVREITIGQHVVASGSSGLVPRSFAADSGLLSSSSV
jgi:hypothetical protein